MGGGKSRVIEKEILVTIRGRDGRVEEKRHAKRAPAGEPRDWCKQNSRVEPRDCVNGIPELFLNAA